jgi:excisionase family DNA binding protein
MNKKISRKLDQGPFPRRWLKVMEAAQYLGSSPKGLYHSLSTRKIPFSKVRGIGIRVDRLELDKILERGQIPAR